MRNLGELRSRAPHGVLLALLVGLMARLARWLCCVRVVEIDGAWYARLAERLSDGAYEGLVPGPEVMFPPLYPAGIAALAATGLDPVTAGRLLSLAGGLAVIVLGWRLARRLGGDRAATATAWFLALAPAQIASSVA
ncbi:MAG: hypothetical protein CMJ83_18675, partial [Planctomycetes bacterium]|nr:hypothetical protein [Planctomycetota bacterium]